MTKVAAYPINSKLERLLLQRMSGPSNPRLPMKSGCCYNAPNVVRGRGYVRFPCHDSGPCPELDVRDWHGRRASSSFQSRPIDYLRRCSRRITQTKITAKKSRLDLSGDRA